MTKSEIMRRLNDNAIAFESYMIDDDVRQAMVGLSNPFELVEPILYIIGTNPDVDFGMPGDLVHFVEHFCGHGYEELLMASVAKYPTPHNIWMLHRCYNNPKDSRGPLYVALVELLLEKEDTPNDVKNEIREYEW